MRSCWRAREGVTCGWSRWCADWRVHLGVGAARRRCREAPPEWQAWRAAVRRNVPGVTGAAGRDMFPPATMPPPVLHRHPFLAVGILGMLLFVLWLAVGAPIEGVGRVLFYSWRTLAAPMHLAANLLSPVTDTWPDVLDSAAVAVSGLAPYAAADWFVRRWQRQRRPALNEGG